MTRLLILGGTSDAARLAETLAQCPGLTVINSLAGRTPSPRQPAGEIRMGGFGGADGLADYLRSHHIDRVVDATHPFAARISAHAAQACAVTGTPRLMLLRPRWPRHPQDRRVMAESMAEAARMLPGLGRRAFLTIGINDMAAFAGTSIHCLVRLLTPQPLPLADYTVVTGRGPFDADAERSLMQAHSIDVVVTKESGGAATEGKIIAARDLGLNVLMIRRPAAPMGEAVDSIDAAAAWVMADHP